MWFAVACVQLMLGDIQEARVSAGNVQDRDLLTMLKGLCSFSEGEYKCGFDCILQINPLKYMQIW